LPPNFAIGEDGRVYSLSLWGGGAARDARRRRYKPGAVVVSATVRSTGSRLDRDVLRKCLSAVCRDDHGTVNDRGSIRVNSLARRVSAIEPTRRAAGRTV
jgi:hypothetical protein